MDCPNCKKISRCGCGSCKSRVKYPMQRASKITNHPEYNCTGIIQCPYCRKRFSEEHLTKLEYEKYKQLKQ